ncbi:MAG: hypothetical protein ACHRHE_16270 [Tepidisphaerales bacterium]
MYSTRAILLCCLLAAPSVFGLELAEVPEQWRLSVVRLGDPDPAVRKKAADDLLAGGGSAAKALAVAAQDNSSEVGAAARDILRDLAVGITARTPAKLVDIVRQYRHGYRMRDDVLTESAVKAFCQNSPEGYVLLAGLVELDKAGNGFAHFMPKPVLGDAAQAAPSVAVRLLQEGREFEACRVLHMASLLEDRPDRGDANFVTVLALALPDNEELSKAWEGLRVALGEAASNGADHAGRGNLQWKGQLELDPNPDTPSRADDLRGAAPSMLDLRSLAFKCEWRALAARLPPENLASGSVQIMAATALSHRLAATGGLDEVTRQLKRVAETRAADGPVVAEALVAAGRLDEAIPMLKPPMQADLLGEWGRYADALDVLAGAEPPALLQTRLTRIEAERRLGLPIDTQVAQLTDGLVVEKNRFQMQAAVEFLYARGWRREALEIVAATAEETRQWDEQVLFQSLYGQRNYDAVKLFRWLELEKGQSLPASLLRLDRIMSGRLDAAGIDAMVDKLRKDTDNLAIVNTLVPTVCRVVRLHGQPQRAREMLLRASKGRFSLNGIKGGAGEELMRLGAYAEAARLFEQAAGADPDPLLRYLWGTCAVRAGDERLGRAICRTASLMPLGNARQRLDMAIALFDEGFSEEAGRELAICLRMRRFAPAEAAEALPYLAVLRYERGDFQGAADAVSQSLMLRFLQGDATGRHIGKDYHRFLRYRIRAAVARGDKPAALADLDEAMRVFPDDPVILFDVLPAMLARPDLAAEARPRLGQWIARREKQIEKYPNSAELRAGLALILIRQGGDTTRAGSLLDRAAQIDTDDRNVRLTRAEFLLVRGDRGEAIEMIRPLALRDSGDRSLLIAARRLEKGKTEDPWPDAD